MKSILSKKLYELRIKCGFSVEELAEKTGLSPDLIKGIESGEKNPCVDDLITLSKFYGVSLDSLVAHDEKSEEKRDRVSFKNGIHVSAENGDHVDIGPDGIHIDSAGSDRVHIDKNGVFVNGREKKSDAKSPLHKAFLNFPFPVLCILLYLIFGFLNVLGGWGCGWIVFLTIPVYYSLVDAAFKHKASHFAYPVLTVIVYLILGFSLSYWHPGWVIFLTIPIYYYICSLFEKY